MIYKQVIVMRRDINMRRGKEIAQGSHASLTSGLIAIALKPVWFLKWFLLQGQRKICCQVQTEDEIKALELAASKKGLPVMMIVDSGTTEFGGKPTITCIAIGPAPAAEIDEITKSLKLY
jgi:PTH2 family peptidyl-tRNA hydrolase